VPRIKIAEDLLYFEDKGEMARGTTFLLLHGAAGSSAQWQAVYQDLEKEHRVLALDLPGHGNSSGRGSRSVDSYVKVVRAFTETLNLSNFIFCGHSLGGAIAMDYALKHPEDLQGLVLAATGARLKVAPLFLEICLEGDMDKLQIVLSKYAFSHTISLMQIKKWQQQWRFPPREIVYGDFLACNAFDRLAEVEKISPKTLILCGDEDRMTPLRFSEYLAEKITNSSLDVIPDGGHMLMAEKPRELGSRLARFALEVGQGV
jgi:pimeloyl-ACP methyl ester carboxylesterase